MSTRLDKVAQNGLFSQLPACFQAVEPFHQDEPIAIAPHQNRYLLAQLQNALGDLLRLFRIEHRSALGRDVDARDCNPLLLHHGCAIPALPIKPPLPLRLPASHIVPR